jgi:hypothetical protein
MKTRPTYSDYYPVYLYGNPLSDQCGLGVTHFSVRAGEKNQALEVGRNAKTSADLSKNKEPIRKTIPLLRRKAA